ncbi:uncharacterized protein LOC123554742 [Mercenaria mercenaria]|uniref:uncharacterized protein LOC123554742 n=1 Tax=Mercenaria mercenaria TaxID=6596 RepID=UPI00234F6901|nr:uncharacterized protein LOC123554742 [Mercenaria mercenaria]
MDTMSLSHISCLRCYSVVGKDTELLLCNSCEQWQHKKCSEGVSEKFYFEFYLATVLGEKPTQWTCQFCSEYQSMVNNEQQSPSKTQKTLLLIPNQQLSQTSDNNKKYDSDNNGFGEFSLNCEIQDVESFGEFSLNCDIQDVEREGPPTDISTNDINTDEELSFENISTPFHIPTSTKRFSYSYCSDTTDDEDSNPAPLSTAIIQRLTATTATVKSEPGTKTTSPATTPIVESEPGSSTPSSASTPFVESEQGTNTAFPSATPVDESEPGTSSSSQATTPIDESEPGTSMQSQATTPILETEQGANTPTPASYPIAESEPGVNITLSQSITDKDEVVFHEIEACLPRQKKPGTQLVSSDGFIFQTKIEDSANNKTYWHCMETSPDGTECEASLVYNKQPPFSHDGEKGRTWLINRENGQYIEKHKHKLDYRAVAMAKVRMMIKRRIFLYGVLDEVPTSIISNIFDGFDHNGLPYCDSKGNPVLTAVDKNYLPCSPVQIQVLKRFIRSQKDLYKEENKKQTSS